MSLQALIDNSYQALLYYASHAKIVLLHPHSRYRSLVVAKLLAEQPQPVYYYAMGIYDVNLPSFLAGFTHDLAEQVPTFGRRINQVVKQIGTIPPAELVDALAQDLADLSEKPFFLVLDEYDASENADDVQEFLEDLLMRLPAHCQVIINSRHMPRLPWIALVARNEALILEDDRLVTHSPYRLTQEADGVAKVIVRSLGPNVISKNKHVIDDWEGHLPRLLFIFALERPVVTRSEICSAFWPSLDSDQAVNVFHVTKRRLHKALGFDALVHEEGYYQVNPHLNIDYDVTRFVSALVRGRISTGDEASSAWQEAIDIYQGPFLQGHTEEWVIQQRQAYQMGYLEATMAVANMRVEAGRPEHALRLLVQATQQNNEFESLHHEIMKLYTSLGRRSEAAAHYQNLVASLKEQGAEPSPATQQLYQELMS